jgi:hypothetical protein
MTIQGNAIYQVPPAVRVELSSVQLRPPGEDDRMEHRVVLEAGKLKLEPTKRAQRRALAVPHPLHEGRQVDLVLLNAASEANKAIIAREIKPLKKLAAQRVRQGLANTAEGGLLGAVVGGGIGGGFKGSAGGPLGAALGATAGAALAAGVAYRRACGNAATLKSLEDVQSVFDLYDRYADGIFDEQTLCQELTALRRRSAHFDACGKKAVAELERHLLANRDDGVMGMMQMYHIAKNTLENHQALEP